MILFLKTEKKLVKLSDYVLPNNECDFNSILLLGFDGVSTLNREEKVVFGLMTEKDHNTIHINRPNQSFQMRNN